MSKCEENNPTVAGRATELLTSAPMRTTVHVILGLLALPAVAHAQSASIEGTVVSQATNAPLKNAVVQLGELTQQTNDQGKFRFIGVSDGQWSLSASKTGFCHGAYGERKYLPGGVRISVKVNEHIKDVVLKLLPQSVIAGRVVDAEGEPVEEARVTVLKAVYIDGVRRWLEVASATTLDNGEYRVPKIPVGHYLVKGTVTRMERIPSAAGIETAYATTYHPDAIDPQVAQPVDILDGSEMRGIDIRLARTPVFHVRGKFQAADKRYANVAALVSESDPAKAFVAAHTQPPDYTFDFARIPPGSYTAYVGPIVNSASVATEIIQVSTHDVDNLVLAAGASEIPGILKLKPGNREVDLRKISVLILPIKLDTSTSPFLDRNPLKIGDDLRFRFPLPTQPNFVNFAVDVSELPVGCYVDSIQYGGQPVHASSVTYSNGAALEIIVGSDGGQIEGTAHGKDDALIESAVVALMPSGGTRAPRSLLSGTHGAFRFSGIPPGDYQLLAWDDITPDELADPGLLARFQGQASQVKLTNGATVTAAVHVIPAEVR
jgi:hypothetical protein